MSFFSRLRSCSPYEFLGKPFSSHGHYLVNSVLVIRGLAQPAFKVDVEKVEIYQRRLPADYDPATFEPTQHRSPPTERVRRLADEITSLKLVETQSRTEILMRKMNMKEPLVFGALIMKGPTAAAAAQEEKKVWKTFFELKLESFDAVSKIKVMKLVRTFTDLGLNETKELVEKAPVVFKTGVSREEGEKKIERMKPVGARVVM